MRTRTAVALPILMVVLTMDPMGVGLAQLSNPGDTARALQELTAEIRALRSTVAQSAENQLQGQLLGLSLTLQQTRLVQAVSRMDAVRRELEIVVNRGRDAAQGAADDEALLTRESDPERRRKLELSYRQVKREVERLAAEEQQIRSREAEVYQALQTEEARWNDLVARLEQLLKK